MLGIAVLFTAAIIGVAFFLMRHFGPEGALETNRNIQQRIGQGTSAVKQSKSFLVESNISQIFFLKRFLDRHSWSQTISILLKSAKISVSVSVFLLVSALFGIIFFMLCQQFSFPVLATIPITATAAATPFIVLKMLRGRYISKFELYLIDTLGIISSAIKVGHGLETSFALVAKRAPYPVNHEFETVQAQTKLGIPLRTALLNLQNRVESPELRIFVSAIGVQQELGGNLSELLDNLQKMLRDRFALRREIKTLSAQGIVSAIALSLIPFAIAGILIFNDSKTFFEFFYSPLGQKVMWACVILQVAGMLGMYLVIQIKD